MNVAEFAAAQLARAERLRTRKDERARLAAFIQRLRIEHEHMNEEIAMLEDHIAKDEASGSFVMPVPAGADDDNRMDKAA